jgi:hypothetical protein
LPSEARRPAVAVIMQQLLPAGVPIAMLDGVTEEMGVKTDPPAGLIVHSHYQDGDRVRITDMWDSEAEYRAFRDARLWPAMKTVAGRAGVDISPSDQMEPVFLELQDFVRGG